MGNGKREMGDELRSVSIWGLLLFGYFVLFVECIFVFCFVLYIYDRSKGSANIMNMLKTIATAAVALTFATGEAAETTSQPMIIFDAHCDSILNVINSTTETLNSDANPRNQADVPKWKRGGVNVIGMAVFVNPERFPDEKAQERADMTIRRIHKEVVESGGDMVVCRTADEITSVAQAGKIAVVMTMEGGQTLNNDPRNVRMYAAQGIRSLTLTWNKDLPWAGSVMGEQNTSKTLGRGLSDVGREIVREMNAAGMVVDLSHASDQTVFDVLKVAKKPVIASHSNSRTLTPYPRNLTDEMAKGIAATGGVVCIGFAPYFITDNPIVTDEVALAALPAKDLKTTVVHVGNHIRYMVDLLGIDHVGIGSDFDGFRTQPVGLEGAGEMQNLVNELRKTYGEDDVRKIMGLNLLRVYRECE